ncbi:MAG: ABC transporter substrate-binding protein [Comamonas sp.]
MAQINRRHCLLAATGAALMPFSQLATAQQAPAATKAVADAGAKAVLQPFINAQPAQAAKRLITLSGALTEIVYQLGAQSLLVGSDTTSNYPDAANHMPKVGYVRQLAAEGVLSLKPDTVIGTTEAGPPVVLQQVAQAGVVIALVQSDHTWDEVLRKIALVGQATGKQAQATQLAQSLQAQWDATQAQVRAAVAAGRAPRALFVLSHSGSPQVAGQGTAGDALLRLGGASNVMHGFGGYRPLTAEAMAQAAPQVIVTTTQGIEAVGGEAKFWARPELALTPAYKTKALIAVEASQLLGFGPRLPLAVQTLHQGLQAIKA